MRRAWLLWTIFALCLAIGLLALAWISLTILRLESRQIEAQRQALVEENVRLALWRMDSAIAPLIAQETARPYFAYSAFTPAERAYTRMYNQIGYGDVLVPSPLLGYESPLIHLHFQFAPDGALSSPQVPTGNMRDVASQQYTTRKKIQAADELLRQFQTRIAADRLLPFLPADTTPPPPPAAILPDELNEPVQQQSAQAQQAKRSIQEFQARNYSKQQADEFEYRAQRQRPAPAAGPSHVREGIMKVLWVGDMLLLARRVSINDATYVQGCWLNWPAIRASLLDSARDLLPAAHLVPADPDPNGKQPHRLASLPTQLVPGPTPAAPPADPSPIRITLLIAWVCVLIGSAAIGLLLGGALVLSERRGAFVSAVTHELRTPLTTVSMYAEMLEEGMVPPEKRREYLATLRAEASRLGHLVENVLAYSRIERGRARTRIQPIALAQLIETVQQRLSTRAQQAGLELRIELPEPTGSATVLADPSAVEQILFNLVDNAAKYAARATDRRLHLQAQPDGAQAVLRVRDYGPGIPPQDARKLFRPFSKSARDAAHSAPGVGLGLALSRRLAREMRGDLRLEATDGGASFILTLPTTVLS